MQANYIPVLLVTVLLYACSSDEPGTGTGDHVWKDQVDTIDKAKQAEQKILDAADLQRKAIEEQTQ